MKRLILFVFLFVLVNSAFAGKIYDVDFSEGPTHIAILNEGDVIRFNFSVREYEDRIYSTLEEKKNSNYRVL